jgi:hypothetical protein
MPAIRLSWQWDELADCGDHVGGRAVAGRGGAGQPHLVMHAADQWTANNNLGGCVVDIGHHFLDDSTHDAFFSRARSSVRTRGP